MTPETTTHRPHSKLPEDELVALTATLRATADAALDADGATWAAAEYAARVAEREVHARAMLAVTLQARNPADATRLHFDTEPCRRCGGCGRFSYCTAHQDRCFRCWGSGIEYTAAGAERANEWQAAVRVARQPSAEGLKVGDVILTSTEEGYPMGPGNKGTFRRVTSIVVTEKACSWYVPTHLIAEHKACEAAHVPFAEDPHHVPTGYVTLVGVEGFDEPFEVYSQTIRRRANLTLPTGRGVMGWVDPIEPATPRQMAAKRAARTRRERKAAAAAGA